MSREKANSGKRCANCGGRMRLVNVTWINRFQAPEASLYDSSVSRRKAKLGIVPKLSAQELMCTCCGQRIPFFGGKTKTVKKEKVEKQKAEKQKVEKVEKQKVEKSKKRNKKRVVAWIKFLIFLIAISVIAYFAYQYKDVLLEYWKTAEGIIGKIQDLIAKFKK